MPEPNKPVETLPGFRVTTDTLRRRLVWLIALSIVLHSVLTPLAGWLGLFSSWFAEADEPPPAREELEGIPIELWEEPEPATAPAVPELPSEDPVEVIEELIALPEAALPKPQPTQPKPAASPAKPEPSTSPTEPSASVPPAASASTPPSSTAAPGDAGPPVTKPNGDAGAPPPASPDQRSQPSPIESPVALLGPTADLVKSNAKLQLVMYTDRIRQHALGERMARFLPALPQWNDFFEGGAINPIRDFDRFFVAGPSFYYSDQLFIALQYNATRRQVHRAIDHLVQRNGRWLKDAPVPAALAVADRAERLFVMPKSKLVFIAPPRLREQVLRLPGVSLPEGRGNEALVATIKDPKKSLWFLGLSIPDSVTDVRLRVTPLPKGALELELHAQAPDEATARDVARRVGGELNAKLELLSGVSDLLGRFGFGALTRGMAMPRIELRPQAETITSRVTLDAAQVKFILDRVENYLLARVEQNKRAPANAAPTAARAPASGQSKPSKPAGTSPTPPTKPRGTAAAPRQR